MTDVRKKYTLFYGAHTFEVRDDSLLAEYTGAKGTIKVRLANDDWITLAVGPSVPIAIVEHTVRPPRQGRGIIVG